MIAAQGGTIHSSIGLTTTMLVVAADEPFGHAICASTIYRRAIKAADARGFRIVSAHMLGLAQKA
jgi:DNA polymerase-3 subunit epsilon